MEPVTRQEQYLAAIAGETDNIPEKPITREEWYLQKIYENGRGGGGTKSPLTWKDTVPTTDDLSDDAEVGDVYRVSADGNLYAWNGEAWGSIGPVISVDDELDEDSRNPVENKAVAGEVADLKSAIGTLGNDKADIIVASASGDIASFPDGADGLPVKDLTVQIEPVQDLHGYDYPWPAGGGKNLLDLSKVTLYNGAYGLSFSLMDNVFRVYGTINATGTGAFALFQYANTSLSGRNLVVQALDVTGGTLLNIYGFRTETEKDVAIAIDRVSGTAVDIKFKITVAETSQTAWTPYSNMCPITGGDGGECDEDREESDYTTA